MALAKFMKNWPAFGGEPALVDRDLGRQPAMVQEADQPVAAESVDQEDHRNDRQRHADGPACRLQYQQDADGSDRHVHRRQGMGRRKAVHDVFVVHEHVTDASQRQRRQAEVRPRYPLGRVVLARRPQQERQHQAEAERDEQQRVLVWRVDRQPSVDVID
jgi:hypothetical protein